MASGLESLLSDNDIATAPAGGVTGAFERGVARVSGLLDQFQRGSERAVRQRALRKLLADIERDELLAPLRMAAEQADLQLKAAKAGEELKILPKRTELLQGQLDILAKGVPAEAANVDVEVSNALQRAAWKKAALQRDPSGALWRAFELYSNVFPESSPPMTPEGTPDFEAARERVAPLLKSLREAQLGGLTDVSKAIFDEAIKTGVPVVDTQGRPRALSDVQADLASAKSSVSEQLLKQAAELGVPVVTETGTLRPLTEIQRDLTAAKKKAAEPKLTGEQSLEASNRLASISDMLDRIKKLQSRVFAQVSSSGEVLSPTAKINVLGPIVGSWPARAAMAVLAPERAAIQDEFARLAADFTREKTRELKGALSNKELAFIQASVAQVTNTEASWMEFLNRVRPVLERAQARLQAQLSAPASAEADTKSPISRVVIVDTVAEARKLPPGTRFQLANDASNQVYRVPSR